MLIEKPLGSAADGIDSLIALIEDRNLFAHVGSNWKFHPAFVAMKRKLDEGGIGRVTGAQVLAGQWLPDWHPWEDYRQGYSARADLGGGVVLDTHELDYLTWLLGPVRAVAGMTARSGALDIETEDVAAICLRFESGALATVQVDYIQRDYRRRYHIAGDGGTIEWDVRGGTVSHYRADTERTETIAAPLGDVNEMYLAQMRHVLDGLRGLCAPVTPVGQAARVLALQLAVKERAAAA
jgi:predicted dehydrogenase